MTNTQIGNSFTLNNYWKNAKNSKSLANKYCLIFSHWVYCTIQIVANLLPEVNDFNDIRNYFIFQIASAFSKSDFVSKLFSCSRISNGREFDATQFLNLSYIKMFRIFLIAILITLQCLVQCRAEFKTY